MSEVAKRVGKLKALTPEQVATALTDAIERDRSILTLASVVDTCEAESDNQIMTEISATDASKRFADLLDAVEHRGETFNVVRRGRVIATVAPARRTSLGELRAFLRDHPVDSDWARDLADLRRFVGSAPMTDPWKD